MVLYGASGHGRVIADILKLSGNHDIVFWDDDPSAVVDGFQTVSPQSSSDREVIISVGNNSVRKKIAETLDCRYGIAIHPNAIIAKDVMIGRGSVVMAGAIVNAGSKIGQHCIINSGAIIEHNSVIEDFAHVSPGATISGTVSIKTGAWVGSGAIIIPHIHVGQWAVVGAGSVIVRNVPDFAVAVGNPARVIKYVKNKA